MAFIDSSTGMVRLADDVRGHVYFYKDGQWIKSRNKVNLPEGWFAGAVDLSAPQSD